VGRPPTRMDRAGTVEAVFLAPDAGEAMRPVDDVEAVADRGLRGDRYFHERGLYDEREDLPEGADVTLIEREALARAAADYDLDLDPADTRRNLLTESVPLNHLVGREFRVGEALLVGRQLCEPCGYMESLAENEGVADALVHRGGLEADVVESGAIAVGDAVEF